jgi:hypothetical protein
LASAIGSLAADRHLSAQLGRQANVDVRAAATWEQYSARVFELLSDECCSRIS